MAPSTEKNPVRSRRAAIQTSITMWPVLFRTRCPTSIWAGMCWIFAHTARACNLVTSLLSTAATGTADWPKTSGSRWWSGSKSSFPASGLWRLL
jgi:hypothetical protein